MDWTRKESRIKINNDLLLLIHCEAFESRFNLLDAFLSDVFELKRSINAPDVKLCSCK